MTEQHERRIDSGDIPDEAYHVLLRFDPSVGDPTPTETLKGIAEAFLDLGWTPPQRDTLGLGGQAGKGLDHSLVYKTSAGQQYHWLRQGYTACSGRAIHPDEHVRPTAVPRSKRCVRSGCEQRWWRVADES